MSLTIVLNFGFSFHHVTFRSTFVFLLHNRSFVIPKKENDVRSKGSKQIHTHFHKREHIHTYFTTQRVLNSIPNNCSSILEENNKYNKDQILLLSDFQQQKFCGRFIILLPQNQKTLKFKHSLYL